MGYRASKHDRLYPIFSESGHYAPDRQKSPSPLEQALGMEDHSGATPWES